MHLFLRPASVALALLIASLTTAQAQTMLRWKLQPNQTLHYSIGQDVISNFESNGQPVQMTVTQQLDMRWQVEAVDADGAATLSQTIDRVRIKVEPSGQPAVEYDSAAKEEPQGQVKILASFFGLLVNQSIATKVNSRGEVLEFKFPADVLEKMKQLPDGGQMGTLLSEQGMKQLLDIMALPEEAVVAGKTWQRHSDLNPPGVGKEDIDTTYTYAGNETKDGRELEKLDLSVIMKFTPDEKQATAVEIKEQDTTGAIYFDNAAGYLVQSDATSKLQLQISLQGNKFMQNMQIVSRMKLVPEAQK
jgi:hypothetical protein